MQFFPKLHFWKVQGKVCFFLKEKTSSLKSAIWVRFATKQTIILEMKRPLLVRRRLFCNFVLTYLKRIPLPRFLIRNSPSKFPAQWSEPGGTTWRSPNFLHLSFHLWKILFIKGKLQHNWAKSPASVGGSNATHSSLQCLLSQGFLWDHISRGNKLPPPVWCNQFTEW